MTIDSAFDKARALDVAQRNSESYVSSRISASTTTSPQTVACVERQGDATFAVYKNKACFICGSEKRHDRKKCPALSAVCYKSQKSGLFANVCRSSSSTATTGTSACASSPALCSVQGAPECLSFAVTTVIVGKRCLSALIDPGGSLSFMNEESAKTLHLPICPSSHNVSMAVGSLKGSVLGHCSTEITLNGTVYENVQLKVMRNSAVTFCWDKTSSGSTDVLCSLTIARGQNW